MWHDKLCLTERLFLLICVVDDALLENALELAHLVSFLSPSYGGRLVITLTLPNLLSHQYLNLKISLSP